MKINRTKLLKKLTSLTYTASIISLIIGVVLSVVSQPVYASAQGPNTGGDKVWICHVPPGNPENAHAINVDANGWDGHDIHSGDFLLSGENDPRCGGVQGEDPTNTPNPTAVNPTDTQVPTEPVNTATSQPTVGQELTATNTPTTEATNDHKVWICHLPPGNPENALALNVDADGWSGHDIHVGDFEITGPDDPRCAAPTSTPTSTATVVIGATLTPVDTATPDCHRIRDGYSHQYTYQYPNGYSNEHAYFYSYANQYCNPIRPSSGKLGMCDRRTALDDLQSQPVPGER